MNIMAIGQTALTVNCLQVWCILKIAGMPNEVFVSKQIIAFNFGFYATFKTS